jgi:hypothetical protein
MTNDDEHKTPQRRYGDGGDDRWNHEHAAKEARMCYTTGILFLLL